MVLWCQSIIPCMIMHLPKISNFDVGGAVDVDANNNSKLQKYKIPNIKTKKKIAWSLNYSVTPHHTLPSHHLFYLFPFFIAFYLWLLLWLCTVRLLSFVSTKMIETIENIILILKLYVLFVVYDDDDLSNLKQNNMFVYYIAGWCLV